MRRKNFKGFTLVELLVVVAIIGILAAISVSVFQEYRKRGYDVAAKSDLRNLINGIEAYYIDNTAYPDSIATLIGGNYGVQFSPKTNHREINVEGTAPQVSYDLESDIRILPVQGQQYCYGAETSAAEANGSCIYGSGKLHLYASNTDCQDAGTATTSGVASVESQETFSGSSGCNSGS